MQKKKIENTKTNRLTFYTCYVLYTHI